MAEIKEQKMKFDYDQDADVMSVSFGTGEPSFSEEIDDHLVMDFGIYTGAPTGFQVLHVREAGVKSMQIILQKKLPEMVNRKRESLKAVASVARMA
jgi:hypothetical protein